MSQKKIKLLSLKTNPATKFIAAEWGDGPIKNHQKNTNFDLFRAFIIHKKHKRHNLFEFIEGSVYQLEWFFKFIVISVIISSIFHIFLLVLASEKISRKSFSDDGEKKFNHYFKVILCFQERNALKDLSTEQIIQLFEISVLVSSECINYLM